MMQSAPPQIKSGDIIAGKYRVERILGQGAMGMVVAAMHVDLHERRAIKFMLPGVLNDQEGVERFLREARASAKLKSKHVAAVYDVGRLDNGAPYIVMEYLEGTDLKDVLEKRNILPVPQAVDYILQVLEAIGEAHQAGIVHRDLKPANMYLASGVGGVPCVKILDFGIAKLAPPPTGDPAAQQAQQGMTMTGMIMGSPLYMSPEQMRNSKDVDARSDLWAIGVILYEMIAGITPFYAPTPPELFAMVLKDATPRPSTFNPKLPPGFEEIILKCLEKDAKKRFQNAAELANALRPYSKEQIAPLPIAEPAEAATLVKRPAARSTPDNGERPAASGTVAGQTAPAAAKGGTVAYVSQPGAASPNPPAPSGATSVDALSWSDSDPREPLPKGGTQVMNARASRPSTPSDAGLAGQTGRAWAPHGAETTVPQRKSHVVAIGVAVGGVCFLAGIGLLVFMNNGDSTPANALNTSTPETTVSVQPTKPIVEPREPSLVPSAVVAPSPSSSNVKSTAPTSPPPVTAAGKPQVSPSATAQKTPPAPAPGDSPFTNADRRPSKP